jgi:Na+-driven multidrug efflux pump
MKMLGKMGALMALQRVTEWGNMMALTSVLGRLDSQNLILINSSIQIMGFFNLFSQGIGLGANLILGRERKEFQQHLGGTPSDLYSAQQDLRHIRRTVKNSLLSGAVVNGILAVVLFFAREQIVNLFSKDNLSDHDQHIAETALWIMGLSLVVDALRIISGTCLNAWDKLMFQNVVAIMTMTVVGIPLGYGVGKWKSNDDWVTPMFAVRTAMIALSAIINVCQLSRSLAKDQHSIDSVQNQLLGLDGYISEEDVEDRKEVVVSSRR